MFIGTFRHNLDAKNRVTVPRKILEEAKVPKNASSFYLSVGLDDCLFLFTEERWGEMNQTLEKLTLATEAERDFQRLFYSDTQEVDVDGSGRILIPEVLKQAAGLAREVVFLGAGTRVEIWDAAKWDARKGKVAGGFTKSATSIF